MNVPLFIAKKIAFSTKKSFSAIVIKIAIAAIAISVSVMILTTALIDGFRSGITEKIFGFWGHINIAHLEVKSNMDNVPLPAQADYYKIIDTLGRIPYYKNDEAIAQGKETLTKGAVSHIQQYALMPGIIKTKDMLEGIVLKGTGEDFRWDNMKSFLKKGKILEYNPEEASDGILISAITANRLNLEPDDKIIIHFVQGTDQLRRRFTVQGIYKTGLDEYDNKLALVDIRKIRQLMNWTEDQVGGFEVFLENIDDLDVFEQYIYMELLPSDTYAESIKRKFSQIFDWLELQTVNEQVILLLMVIVSIINMITALLILILERTNMVGILNALGSTAWSIRKIFLYHAAYIVIFGLIIGNFLGLGLGFLQDQFGLITLDESSYYLSVAPIKFNLLKILLINVGTLLITMAFLIIPSFLISRINPVTAIKFN